MSNRVALRMDQIVLLVAGAAGINQATAGSALQGRRISRRTREALMQARGNLDTIKDELAATLDRLAGDAATAANASGV
jgi:hypothetical protein